MSRIKSLDELSKMFAENYAVVSLKFVKSFMAHPKQANDNAKKVLEKAGFVRGRHINLPEPKNPCGNTGCVCYWRKDYFNGVQPPYEVMKKLANKKVSGKAKPAAATTPEPVADQPKEEPSTSGLGAEQTLEVMQDLFKKTIKNYLRTLPADHQQAFGHLFKAVHQNVKGWCVLTDEDGTTHNLDAGHLPEDARRFYNPLINMFYQGKEFWGPYILWLEQDGKKPERYNSWQKLFEPPYSKSLLSSYFFLTDLLALYDEKAQALGLAC